MLKRFLKFNRRKTELTPLKEEIRTSQVSYAMQKAINGLKPKRELAQVLVDRNTWSMLAIILSICLLIALWALYIQNERFAHHVKIAFVKLDPSGNTSLSFYDEKSKPVFFMNTIHALLANYIERRYSKINYSIAADYGYVINFMSPPLKKRFLEEYKAAKVAADFMACTNCQQIRIAVRNIQHHESDDVILNGKSNVIYRSILFIRATAFNTEGMETSKANQIVTLTWRIRDVSEMPSNLNAIQANPIGIEILSESLKDDPTPVT